MSVYSIGLLQGYLPNGVDNAQGYRERFFNDLELNNYCEYPSNDPMH